VLLFCRGEMLSPSSPPPGESKTVVVVAPRGEEYHVVAAVEGHELEAPEAEHRPGLKRLLKTPHMELNGKVFVSTQQAPTWRANCRRFGPGGSLDRRVRLSLRVPAQMGSRGGRSGRIGSLSISLSLSRRACNPYYERHPWCRIIQGFPHILCSIPRQLIWAGTRSDNLTRRSRDPPWVQNADIWFVLASITKKGEIEREIGSNLFLYGFWWLNCPTQIIELTSLL
jgi:hypothetical protein